MRSRAFNVVAEFEAALSEFTGAPHVVTVDSCTNALFLALKWDRPVRVVLPKHTYVGVVLAARRVCEVSFRDYTWTGSYEIGNTNIWDCAKHFTRNMHIPGLVECVSFQAGKLLPIGRGGAILTDDAEAADWLRKARLDGRTAGADYQDNTYQAEGYHCYMTPPDAARGLWLMTYIEDGPDDTWEAYPDLSEATWT